jgi:hypothetical protein
LLNHPGTSSVAANAVAMIGGLHEAFLILGGFTVLSTAISSRLKSGDGENETHQYDIGFG